MSLFLASAPSDSDSQRSLGRPQHVVGAEHQVVAHRADDAHRMTVAPDWVQALTGTAPGADCCAYPGVMPAVGDLVRSIDGAWMVRPPTHCAHGHRLRPGRMLVGSIACSCGRHLTWRCECGAVTYGPALAGACSLLNGPARVR